MVCHNCKVDAFKFGIQNGYQRYRCKQCCKTFSDIPRRPLDEMRVEPEKAYQVVQMLVEGVGIRAIERLTQLNRRTVLSILELAGKRCAQLLDKVCNLSSPLIQADELIAFVYCKQRYVEPEFKQERGDFFTYLAVDPNSKLIVTHRTAKRTREDALAFLFDLKGRVNNRFQLNTDNWKVYSGYCGAVREVFGEGVDYAVETKMFAKPEMYAPRQVIGVRRKQRIGNPDMKVATTCHTERTNLSVRLFSRRFTRLTLGYSKKLDNLKLSVALFIAHFNFCRIHSSLNGKTPAMAAGLTEQVWTIEELLKP